MKNTFWMGMFLGGITGAVFGLTGRKMYMNNFEGEVSIKGEKHSPGNESEFDSENEYTTTYSAKTEAGGMNEEDLNSMLNLEEKIGKLENIMEKLRDTVAQE